jgi:hypothetical protein
MRVALSLLAAGLLLGANNQGNKSFKPQIPRTWDDAALASWQLPLATAAASPVYVTSDYYYRIPVRPIYKSYPVYAPGKEPSGYFDWVKKQEPEIVFDPARLRSESDWIKTGELVFDAPIAYGAIFGIIDVQKVRDLAWYDKTRAPITKDGVMPFGRYVIRERGKVELGNLSCATCHTRVMPDGSMVRGAQGNFPFDRAIAFHARRFRSGARLEGAAGFHPAALRCALAGDRSATRADVF